MGRTACKSLSASTRVHSKFALLPEVSRDKRGSQSMGFLAVASVYLVVKKYAYNILSLLLGEI